jgi:hypothetical protein
VATVNETAQLLATQVAREADDLAVRTWAGALITAMIAVTIAAIDDPTADYVELIDAAIGYLEAGLPM